MATWDPAAYLAFADYRTRPFLELIAAVDLDAASVRTIVDLGCGPGHLTRYLRQRWPRARIVGVDSSPEMIARARERDEENVEYLVATATQWRPDEPVDLVISNAMFQWIDDQWSALDGVLDYLAPRGTLAVGVPDNSAEPAHRLLYELADREPYAAHLVGARRLAHLGPERYLRFFTERGMRVNAWSTTYLQVLTGDDPVFTWISGTGARPFLEGLDGSMRERFADEYKALLREAYPTQPFGTLFPFTRTFAVASRAS